MASVKKRKDNVYDVTVSFGYDQSGKKLRHYKTIVLDDKLTDKQKIKELEKQVLKFEEEVRNGRHLDGQNITFYEFVEVWKKDYASSHLQPKTMQRYEGLLVRINKALGFYKLYELQPMHLLRFYKELEEKSISFQALYVAKSKLNQILEDNKMSLDRLAEKSGVSAKTIKSIFNGNKTNKAEQICSALNISIREAFNRVDSKSHLSDRTILHHHRLISSILNCAVHWQIIESNCALRVKPPKVQKREMAHFDEDTIKLILELVEAEEVKYKAMLYVAIFSGCRLGELCGLEWKNINFESKTIRIVQAAQYLPDKGIFIKDPKNQGSIREISMPEIAMQVLESYKKWQNEQRLQLGELWQENKEKENSEPRYFVFTQWNGKPIFPSTPSNWFRKFRQKHNLPDVVFHGIRHSNASILIAENVDLQTVAKRLGHSKPTTTTTIYSHFLQKPDKEAASKLDKIFGKKSKDEANKVEEISQIYDIVG